MLHVQHQLLGAASIFDLQHELPDHAYLVIEARSKRQLARETKLVRQATSFPQQSRQPPRQRVLAVSAVPTGKPPSRASQQRAAHTEKLAPCVLTSAAAQRCAAGSQTLPKGLQIHKEGRRRFRKAIAVQLRNQDFARRERGFEDARANNARQHVPSPRHALHCRSGRQGPLCLGDHLGEPLTATHMLPGVKVPREAVLLLPHGRRTQERPRLARRTFLDRGRPTSPGSDGLREPLPETVQFDHQHGKVFVDA